MQRVAPGFFSSQPRVLTMDQPEAKAFVRAAGVALYPPTGFPGSSFVIPNFDHPNRSKDDTIEQLLRHNPFMFAPVWRISVRLGAIPIKVYEFTTKDGRRQRQEAMDHPLYDLLRKPNPDITRNLLISGTVFSMYAFSGMGWYKERAEVLGPRIPSNPVIALWPIPGNLLQPVGSERRLITGYKIRTFTGDSIDLQASDVVFHRLVPDIMQWNKGISPAGPLNDIMDFSNAGLEAMRNLFRSSMLQRIFMNLHGQVLDEELIGRLRAEMEQAALNPYSVPIMEGGATLDAMGQGPDSQLLGSSFELTKKVTNTAFGLIEDEANLTHFYSEVIQPVADAIEQEMERSLVPDFAGDVFPQFAFRQLLEGSPLDRAKLHQIRVLSGQETPDEARGDEDKPPVEGGDQAFVPLNVVPMNAPPVDRNAPPKDSAGGLGGTEGQGTTAKLQLPKAAGADEPLHARAEAIRSRWDVVRETVLGGQAEGLERRLRGVINNERDQLRQRQAPDGLGAIPARTRMRAELYDAQAIEGIMAVTDHAIRAHLESFMRQALGRAGSAAIDLTGESVGFRSEEAEGFLQQRIDVITARFGDRRREHLQKIVDEASAGNLTVRQLDDHIRDQWNGLADHLASRIGTTETAWAFERGAALGWTSAGFPDFVVVRHGEQCRTGMCLEVATAGRYQFSEVPTPLHPGCRCLILPARFVE